jgi:hypothetical protein
MSRIIIACVLFAVVLPIYGQEKGSQPNPIEQTPKQNHSPIPQAPTTFVRPINKQASEVQKDGADEHAKPYFSRLFAPENLPNIGLFVAGILGILVAIRTLRAIEAQTKLQTIGMQQWVDTADWEVVRTFIQPKVTEVDLPISFTVANPTNFKMTVDSVALWINGRHNSSHWFRSQLLAPKDYVSVRFAYRLNAEKIARYKDSVLNFQIGGVVCFVDAFGRKQEQPFGFICACRPTNDGDFEPVAFRPPEPVKREKQKEKEPQNPN